MRRSFILIAVLILFPGASFAGETVVDGLVAYRGDFLPGAVVYALKDPRFDPAEGVALVSGPTDADGRFSLEVPPGKYYMVAHQKGEGSRPYPEAGDHFCFYSGNPVRVAEGETVHVGFNMIVAPDDGQVREGLTGVEGRLLFEDEPLGRAYLYIYRDADDEFRGMGFHTAPIGPDGGFRVRLPPGEYYLIARKRARGGMFGPLQKNDQVGYYYGNPVTVQEGRNRRVVIEAISRVEMLEEIWFQKETAGAYILAGTVRDTGGKPRSGIHILLYADGETSGMPRFISPETGPDGTFRLEIYDGGEYYLVARESLGGPAGSGELYGRRESPDGRPLPVVLGSESREVRVDMTVGEHSGVP